MLVLQRKPGEKLVIGDNITITVVKSSSHAVRFGIDAPKEMNIVRDELLREVAETEEALAGLLAQHEGPLDDDGGPCGAPVLAVTEKVERAEKVEVSTKAAE